MRFFEILDIIYLCLLLTFYNIDMIFNKTGFLLKEINLNM